MKNPVYLTILWLLLSLMFSCSDSELTENIKSKGQGTSIGGSIASSQYYTPKPSNVPVKVPLSVFCNYVQVNFNKIPNAQALMANYCGVIVITGTVPPPQSTIDALNQAGLTHSSNDLYIRNLPNTTSLRPFGSYSSYDFMFPTLRSQIVSFYQKVWIWQLGSSMSVSGNINASQHLNKQAFIDSFFDWLFLVSNNSPNTFSYLRANPLVLNQLFNFFADYNLKYSESEGIYLGVPYGEYAPNVDMRCVTLASRYLATTGGLTLIQQLGSGTMSMEQFRRTLCG
jgi:hypothetical protein